MASLEHKVFQGNRNLSLDRSTAGSYTNPNVTVTSDGLISSITNGSITAFGIEDLSFVCACYGVQASEFSAAPIRDQLVSGLGSRPKFIYTRKAYTNPTMYIFPYPVSGSPASGSITLSYGVNSYTVSQNWAYNGVPIAVPIAPIGLFAKVFLTGIGIGGGYGEWRAFVYVVDS